MPMSASEYRSRVATFHWISMRHLRKLALSLSNWKPAYTLPFGEKNLPAVAPCLKAFSFIFRIGHRVTSRRKFVFLNGLLHWQRYTIFSCFQFRIFPFLFENQIQINDPGRKQLLQKNKQMWKNRLIFCIEKKINVSICPNSYDKKNKPNSLRSFHVESSWTT